MFYSISFPSTQGEYDDKLFSCCLFGRFVSFVTNKSEAIACHKRKNRLVPGRKAIDDGSPIISRNISIDRIKAFAWHK